MVVFTSDQWIILALVFVLGLLVGAFLFAGSGRKWKHRYRSEVDRREAIEREHAEHHRQFEDRERQWREQDSLRAAAIRDNRDSDADRPL
jgi:Flp pilus assembly protein TadB